MRNDYKENFINKSNNLHNNKYDYSLVEYKNARIKVKILCPIHGVFEQCPDTHSRGRGCPKCKGGVGYSKDEFIENSISAHGLKYDYQLVNYKNTSTKVKIMCPIHGVFEQRPNDHLRYGCEKCGIKLRSEKKTLKLDEFIFKSNIIHNNMYDYSKTNYCGHRNKVTIICPLHGEFEQTANSHLSGCGCYMCKESKGEKKIKKCLIDNKIKYIQQKKYKECKDIKPLPFDFYLPEYNVCIEYDGIQHHKSSFFHKNKYDFEKIKIRDQIKNDFCTGLNGRPKLIRISYIDYKKIDDILLAFLNGTI